jgi:hypothetical protein
MWGQAMARRALKATTASGVWRLRQLLAIKLLKNRHLYRLTVRPASEAEPMTIEAIPTTFSEREVDLTVPGVTKMRVCWEEIISIEPLDDPGALDEDDTDKPHPFSSSDLPFLP